MTEQALAFQCADVFSLSPLKFEASVPQATLENAKPILFAEVDKLLSWKFSLKHLGILGRQGTSEKFACLFGRRL